MSVVDGVQVELEDLVLAVTRVESCRQQEFPKLGEPGALGRVEDRHLGELLLDRARSLLGAARDNVHDQSLRDPGPVDSVMLVEMTVLCRQGRVTQRRTDLAQRDRSDPGS